MHTMNKSHLKRCLGSMLLRLEPLQQSEARRTESNHSDAATHTSVKSTSYCACPRRILLICNRESVPQFEWYTVDVSSTIEA